MIDTQTNEPKESNNRAIIVTDIIICLVTLDNILHECCLQNIKNKTYYHENEYNNCTHAVMKIPKRFLMGKNYPQMLPHDAERNYRT